MRLRAVVPAEAVVVVRARRRDARPGVVDAITDADLVVLPPNPVVSVGTILRVPRVREAPTATAAPVVGLSPSSAAATCAAWPRAAADPIGVEVVRPPSACTTAPGPAAVSWTAGSSTRSTPPRSSAWSQAAWPAAPCP